MHLLTRLIIFLFLILTHQNVFPESQHSSSLLDRIGVGKRRPPVVDKLSEDELLFLTETFFRVEDSLKDKFDNKSAKPDLFIAEGITSALSNNPNEIVLAKALADLAGSLNKQQLLNLRALSETLASKIREQEPPDRDLRLLALIERSEWLTYIIEGKLPPPSSLPQSKDEQAFERFKKEFTEAKKAVNERNREILDYVQEAKGGNSDAKKWLRNKLDMKSFATFMQGQKDFGGETLFGDVAEAMVWDDKDLGAKYHDFTKKDGKVVRVVVGKAPRQHAKQLGEYLDKERRNLDAFSLSPTRQSPKESEVINLAGTQLPASATLASKALPVFKGACVDCHKNRLIPMSNFIDAADMVRSGAMPQNRTLTDLEKNTLIDFFLSAEPKEPFLELIR